MAQRRVGADGGLVAQRWGHRTALLVSSTVAWGVGLLLLPAVAAPVPVLLGIGLLLGLPVGVVVALPAEALRPESRATGMGLFYTGLYVGHAALPPVAGWLLDRTGDPAAPLAFAGALVLCVAPLFAALRAVQGRGLRIAAERA